MTAERLAAARARTKALPSKVEAVTGSASALLPGGRHCWHVTPPVVAGGAVALVADGSSVGGALWSLPKASCPLLTVLAGDSGYRKSPCEGLWSKPFRSCGWMTNPLTPAAS